jgi:hypothetical protein
LASLCVAALDSRLDSRRRQTVVRRLREESVGLVRELETATNGLSAPVLRRLRKR